MGDMPWNQTIGAVTSEVACENWPEIKKKKNYNNLSWFKKNFFFFIFIRSVLAKL